jgi:hypothetical protein
MFISFEFIFDLPLIYATSRRDIMIFVFNPHPHPQDSLLSLHRVFARVKRGEGVVSQFYSLNLLNNVIFIF